jgi:hypothetical protein
VEIPVNSRDFLFYFVVGHNPLPTSELWNSQSDSKGSKNNLNYYWALAEFSSQGQYAVG